MQPFTAIECKNLEDVIDSSMDPHNSFVQVDQIRFIRWIRVQ